MNTMRILLVDDEKRFLETTSKLLVKKGVQVETAESGKDALLKLNVESVHVVILDVKMPGMDGNEVLKEIKRHHPMTEVIMLTGHATVESAVEGLKSGAFDYLMKPVDIDELLVKAEEAYALQLKKEEKIRNAEFVNSLKSPREILKMNREKNNK